jgi:hypothetical protein
MLYRQAPIIVGSPDDEQLTAHVELMDSHGRTLVTVVAVNSAADIFPAAEDWADKHGFSDYAGNEWWAA